MGGTDQIYQKVRDGKELHSLHDPSTSPRVGKEAPIFHAAPSHYFRAKSPEIWGECGAKTARIEGLRRSC